MTIKELIAELRKHDTNMPIFLGSPYLYDDDIKVSFDSHYGVILRSPAFDEIFRAVATNADLTEARQLMAAE